MALAAARGLTYWYPGSQEPALEGLEFEIETGLHLVTGASGSGKSTLLRLLNGLVPHFHGGSIAGRVEVAGHDVFTTPTRRLARHVGFVFQDPELQFVYGTVEREVAFGLENAGYSRDHMRSRIDTALAQVDALDLAQRDVHTLSGGERQRVAIAAALVLEPAILALDEPMSQLDSEGAAAIASACVALSQRVHAVVVAEQRYQRFAAAPAFNLVGGRLSSPPERSGEPFLHRRRSDVGDIAWSACGVSVDLGGRAVLTDIEAEGREGEVTAVTGPNGSGKTTLLRALAGLQPLTAGNIERSPGRVAYLPQNPGALLHLPTIRAEVELTLARTGAHEDADRVLEELDLARLADRYPRDVSSGERQRAAIAAVLAGSPRLALLDEPTRGMDEQARARLATVIDRLARGGAAVVVATHDSALVEAVADRVIRLAARRLAAA
jgi:energy-coupling factor transport system ATP-binding protein